MIMRQQEVAEVYYLCAKHGHISVNCPIFKSGGPQNEVEHVGRWYWSNVNMQNLTRLYKIRKEPIHDPGATMHQQSTILKIYTNKIMDRVFLNTLHNCIAWPPWGGGVLSHRYLFGSNLRMQLWHIQALYVYPTHVNQVFEVAYLRECWLHLYLGKAVVWLVLEALVLVSSGCHHRWSHTMAYSVCYEQPCGILHLLSICVIPLHIAQLCMPPWLWVSYMPGVQRTHVIRLSNWAPVNIDSLWECPQAMCWAENQPPGVTPCIASTVNTLVAYHGAQSSKKSTEKARSA